MALCEILLFPYHIKTILVQKLNLQNFYCTVQFWNLQSRIAKFNTFTVRKFQQVAAGGPHWPASQSHGGDWGWPPARGSSLASRCSGPPGRPASGRWWSSPASLPVPWRGLRLASCPWILTGLQTSHGGPCWPDHPVPTLALWQTHSYVTPLVPLHHRRKQTTLHTAGGGARLHSPTAIPGLRCMHIKKVLIPLGPCGWAQAKDKKMTQDSIVFLVPCSI